MKKHLAPCLLITAVMFLVWGESLRTPFFMDDFFFLLSIEKDWSLSGSMLLNITDSGRFSPEEFRDLFPWWIDLANYKFNYFRPVLGTLAALEYAAWGRNPLAFALTNLLLYTGSALLLYGLAVSLGAGRAIAAAAALAAGLHTVNVLSVTWIAHFVDILALFFVLLAGNAYARFLQGEPRRAALLGLTFLLYLLALLTKETAILTPAILFTMAAHHQARQGRGWVRRTWRLEGLPLLPFVVFPLAYAAWYKASGHGADLGYMALYSGAPLSSLILGVGRSILSLAASFACFIPPEFVGARPAPYILALGATALAGLGLLLYRKRSSLTDTPLLWVAAVWTLVFLAVPLLFIPMSRMLYFSAFGYGLLAAAVLHLLLQGVGTPGRRKVRWALFSFYFLLLPAVATWLNIPTLNRAKRRMTVEFNRDLTRLIDTNPGIEDLFLLNSPDPVNTLFLKMVFRFFHPGAPQRLHVLSNLKEVPTLEVVQANRLRLTNGNGLIRSSRSGFQTSHLSAGQRVPGPHFESEITEMDAGTPTQITYTFRNPLGYKGYVFLEAEAEGLRRVVPQDAVPAPER